MTQAEILYGVRLLPSAKRRNRLEAAVGDMFTTDFAGRVLPFDQAAAQAYAEIAVARCRAGRPISQFDAQRRLRDLETPAWRPATSRISKAAALP